MTRRADSSVGGHDGWCRIRSEANRDDGRDGSKFVRGMPHYGHCRTISFPVRIPLKGKNEVIRRSSERTRREGSRQGGPEPLAVGDASRKRTSARLGAASVVPDDDSPEAVHDLLTDAQLAARWQLSGGTLANQRSQGRGPAYLKLAGRVRYRRSDIEAYEQDGFVSREPARETPSGNPIDMRETVERLIQSLSS